MDKSGKKSLALHKKFRGKLKTASKVPLNNLADLALAYTPGVGAVSQSIHKDERLAEIYTNLKNTVAVITDGSAVLGLGNIGPKAALPVMEGKCVLYKKFADIDAYPICLDTQDSESIIQTVKFIAPAFGAIHLEDIAAPRCFEIERRLTEELGIPVMHDDQHSTAVAVLAALINALKAAKIKNPKIVINGAGAAGMGISYLLLEYGFKNIVVLDSKGALNRRQKYLDKHKAELAGKTNPQNISGDLHACLKSADVFIGVSKAGLLKPEMIKQMNKKPIIFALANPIPEIMPGQAHKAGAFIVATGRSDFKNQINNVLTYPGIFRGALDNRVKKISKRMLIAAAKNLAQLVKKPDTKTLLPSLFDKRTVKQIAKAIR